MQIPKLCKQKKSNGVLAFVKINGVRIYCGQWGTPQAEEKYQWVIAEWMTSGQSPVSKKSSVTVAVLVNAFLEEHVESCKTPTLTKRTRTTRTLAMRPGEHLCPLRSNSAR
jgi:hypothetical protein